MKLKKVISVIIISVSFYGFCFAETNGAENEEETSLCSSVDDCIDRIYDLLTENRSYLIRKSHEAAPDMSDINKQERIWNQRLLSYYKRLEELALEELDARNLKHAREEIERLEEILAK